MSIKRRFRLFPAVRVASRVQAAISARAVTVVSMLLSTVFAAPIAHAQSADAALARIKSHQEVVIGYRQSSIPFSYLDSQQQPVGYTIDLCMQVVEALKQKLAMPDLKTRFVAVDLTTIIPLLQNGGIDMECGSTVHTLRRAAQVDFSLVTAAASDQLLVKADSNIQEIEDLAGKPVAVPAGSTNAALVQAINTRQNLNMRIVFVKDQAEGFLTLQTGRADAYISDNVILYGLKSRGGASSGTKVVGRMLSYLPYGIVVAPNNSGLLSTINATLAEGVKSGSTTKLYQKWFSQIGMPANDAVESIFRVNAFPN